MGDWSMLEGQLVDTVGEVAATSYGTVITAHANANTKGSYTQIVAATTYNADGLIVCLSPVTAVIDFLTDIAIGASGSEQKICGDLHRGSIRLTSTMFLIPIAIPAGTRIAARTQCSAGGYTVQVTISLISQGFLPSASLHRVTTYGANTADSGGVSVDPGGTAHTKGAYSQINGATSAPIRALLVAIGGQVNFTRATCGWLVDIAIGAASSERIIIPDLALVCDVGSDDVTPFVLGPFFIDIPAGVRLAARAQCSITDASDRLFDIVLYGID